MNGRTLINFQKLPPRERTLDRDQVDKDVRHAMAEGEKNLRKMAAKYTVTGWTRVGEIEYDHVGDGLIICRMRLERDE